jgi:hypothetical protein
MLSETTTVMPGLVPGIHVFGATRKTWMAGTSPAMTETASVARMERSEIRVGIDAALSFLDFAELRPGYLLTKIDRIFLLIGVVGSIDAFKRARQ